MKNRASFWLFTVLAVLTIIFLLNLISIWELIALSAIWVIGFFIHIVGPETISEITIWKASIKRDVQAAREIREEIATIASDLKAIVRISAENEFILASSSLLGLGDNEKAVERVEHNLTALTDYFEPDRKVGQQWWDELQANTFPERVKDKKSNSETSKP